MNKFAAELDSLCDRIGATPLSSFLDYTDLNANMSEDDDSSDTGELDAETGWSYGIDDMTWFPAKEGLSTLSSLRTRLAADDAQTIPQNKLADLLDELGSYIAKLTEPASRDARFHLAVVM